MIDQADTFSKEQLMIYGEEAKKRIADAYSWEHICSEYKKVFINDEK